MPKDYQEVERIVEEFEATWSDFIGDIEFSEAFAHLAQDPEVPLVLPEMAHWLRTTLTTYSNAQVEEIIKMAEGNKRNYPMVDEPEWRRGCIEALDDLIQAIKK